MRRHIQIFLVLTILMNVFWVASPTYGGSGFTGPYEMQNWSATASNGGTTTITPSSGPATSAEFSYNINLGIPGPGVPFRTWTFSTTAASAGPVTFDWQYDFWHADYHVEAVFKTYAMTSDGRITTTELDFYNWGYTGARSFSGTATINVEKGRPFGFIIGGSNYDWTSVLDGTLTITNFEYSEPEPEPEPIQDAFEESIDPVTPWKSVYDISYSPIDQAVTVNLNIQLKGADPGDALKNQWEYGIENIWGNGNLGDGGNSYKISDGIFEYPIIFDVNWVEPDSPITPHYTVNVWSGKPSGDAWINMLNWYTEIELEDKKTGELLGNELQDEVAAHEAGHMFGLYDEYQPFGTLNPLDQNTYEYSIMADLTPLTYDRHYQGILDWLAGKSGRQLELFSMSLPQAPGYSPPQIDFRDSMPPVTETPIPEPSTGVLVAFGLLASIIMIKKYRKRM